MVILKKTITIRRPICKGSFSQIYSAELDNNEDNNNNPSVIHKVLKDSRNFGGRHLKELLHEMDVLQQNCYFKNIFVDFVDGYNKIYIGDFEHHIVGELPYIAFEVFRWKKPDISNFKSYDDGGDIPNGCNDLMINCRNADPDKRPDSTILKEIFETMVTTLKDPKSFRFVLILTFRLITITAIHNNNDNNNNNNTNNNNYELIISSLLEFIQRERTKIEYENKKIKVLGIFDNITGGLAKKAAALVLDKYVLDNITKKVIVDKKKTDIISTQNGDSSFEISEKITEELDVISYNGLIVRLKTLPLMTNSNMSPIPWLL
ncbi:hypothetical protein Glove_236g67 [Diversispora epigaea]|uniref:Protein kinase domain-containing protein n=1 Tax=Diversispora epigaea TaxID=1348612 RepID=A0A397IJJ9_9GLOM|nr:hypothetical protein Glove_236g67 [Diversispora epigaea]